MDRMQDAATGTVVVIDYLQLLDQDRRNPPLADQVQQLRSWAKARGTIVVFISQVDRTFDTHKKVLPDRADVRPPNPLDLGLFEKTCFLHDGKMSLRA